MKNWSTGKSPFEIVYTKLLGLTVDLANLPSSIDLSLEVEKMVEKVAELHKEVTKHLEKMVAKYGKDADKHNRFKEFKEGDKVMIHLRKNKFPTRTYNKLQP